ncbi:DUF397 domain-containing protein [Streptomyces sp. NPDC059398]|uniref:DUF397 domain-containing protein n=1 Tax=Streptomyces sp. NPDC059398 TaxID=3346820 RepID=UPI0036A402C6
MTRRTAQAQNKRLTTAFRKSSFSSSTDKQECVEVAGTADGGRAVRDSKCPAHGITYHSPAAWAAFLKVVRPHG